MFEGFPACTTCVKSPYNIWMGFRCGLWLSHCTNLNFLFSAIPCELFRVIVMLQDLLASEHQSSDRWFHVILKNFLVQWRIHSEFCEELPSPHAARQSQTITFQPSNFNLSLIVFLDGKGFLLAHLPCKSNLHSCFLMVESCTLISIVGKANCRSCDKMLGFLTTSFNNLHSSLRLNFLGQPSWQLFKISICWWFSRQWNDLCPVFWQPF